MITIAGHNIRNQADLEALDNKALLDFYNARTGKSTTRFASREKALIQVGRLVDEIIVEAGGQPGEAPTPPAKDLQPSPAPAPAPEPEKDPRTIPSPVSPPGDTPRRWPGFNFRLAPKTYQKTPRSGSKRDKALAMVSRPAGALLSDICAACEWELKDAYEGVRLLNVHSGYGLWHTKVGEDYLIRRVDAAEFSALVKEEREGSGR